MSYLMGNINVYMWHDYMCQQLYISRNVINDRVLHLH
jgi:hypothetical protein